MLCCSVHSSKSRGCRFGANMWMDHCLFKRKVFFCILRIYVMVQSSLLQLHEVAGIMNTECTVNSLLGPVTGVKN